MLESIDLMQQHDSNALIEEQQHKFNMSEKQ
jgi:hypothetical protein